MTEVGNEATSVDLIIPVYNDSTGIRETLNSVTELSSEAVELRVFVVDNGSSDETLAVSMEFAEDHDCVDVLIEDEIQGSYAARNTGIRNSKGEVIVFLDADERVPPNFVENALATVDAQNVAYLGCNVEVWNSAPGFTAKFNQQNAFPVEQYLNREHYAPTCALVVRREVFEDVGLFDARLISGGDREFGERVHEAGYEQRYAPEATVYHPARTSFESLAKKNFRVGRGFCQKQRYYPERYGKPGIPPKPSGPNGSDDETEPTALFTRFAFAFLSIAMLACRGAGYYYEFFFGETREDIPAPTS